MVHLLKPIAITEMDNMYTKKTRITGWVLSFLIAAFLIFASAVPKFIDWEGKAKMFSDLGYSIETMMKIGVVEIAVALLFVIPRTSFLGAVLLTAYLGGATATHVRVGDQFFFPIIIGIVAWIALGLRRPEVFSLAFGSSRARVASQNRLEEAKR
jgi:hypothetical protein